MTIELSHKFLCEVTNQWERRQIIDFKRAVGGAAEADRARVAWEIGVQSGLDVQSLLPFEYDSDADHDTPEKELNRHDHVGRYFDCIGFDYRVPGDIVSSTELVTARCESGGGPVGGSGERVVLQSVSTNVSGDGGSAVDPAEKSVKTRKRGPRRRRSKRGS